jgi:hypothetical protein
MSYRESVYASSGGVVGAGMVPSGKTVRKTWESGRRATGDVSEWMIFAVAI